MRNPSEKTTAQIEKVFIYHAPKEGQAARYTRLRAEAKALATTFAQECPESRELSLALTHLEEAIMFANAAIARNE